jgi:hypothetical protein
MESRESFEELCQGDQLIAFDVKSGYHHFRLHPAMRVFSDTRTSATDASPSHSGGDGVFDGFVGCSRRSPGV